MAMKIERMKFIKKKGGILKFETLIYRCFIHFEYNTEYETNKEKKSSIFLIYMFFCAKFKAIDRNRVKEKQRYSHQIFQNN